MKVLKLNEAGYSQAILGLSLSFNTTIERAVKVSKRLYNKDGGHNKFLESIVVWLDINAPRYWWQDFDTYRVGMTKQSESTMHTLIKKPLTQENFKIEITNSTLQRLNYLIENKEFKLLKNELPEGFLQRREVCTNYKTIRNIVNQRKNHKLEEWRIFTDYLINNLEYKEFLE